MGRRGQSKLTILIVFLVIITLLAIWMARSKKKEAELRETPAIPEETMAGKIEMPVEKLDKAWEEAQKIARGEQGPSPEVDYPKEMGNKGAKVRIDAFFPIGAGEGLTVSTNTLKKLVEEYKDKVYVRISLLVGPVAKEVGLDCAAIFINGRNYIRVGEEEIVLMRKNTHNPQLVEKAVKQAVGQAYKGSD